MKCVYSPESLSPLALRQYFGDFELPKLENRGYSLLPPSLSVDETCDKGEVKKSSVMEFRGLDALNKLINANHLLEKGLVTEA